MNATFQRLMAEATRLTQAGDLQGATAAIQAALSGGAAAPVASNEACVIDVEAREVETVAPAAAPFVVHAGQFIAGCHAEAGSAREYKLYVPPGYHGQALPLVVMLHGCKQDPDDFASKPARWSSRRRCAAMGCRARLPGTCLAIRRIRRWRCCWLLRVFSSAMRRSSSPYRDQDLPDR